MNVSPCSLRCLLPIRNSCRHVSSQSSTSRVLFEAAGATLFDFGVPTSDDSRALFRDLHWKIQGDGLQAWALVGSRAATLVDAALLGQARAEPHGSLRWPFLEGRMSPRNMVSSTIRKVAFRTRLEAASALLGAGAFTDYTARYGGIRNDDEDAVTLIAHLLEHVQRQGVEASRQEIEVVCKLLDVHRLLDMPLVTLSNGQTRRARIARALLSRPDMLVLEQPFTGLDVDHRESLSELLFQLHAGQAPHILLTLRPQDQMPECITHVVSSTAAGEIEHIGSRTTWTPALPEHRVKHVHSTREDNPSAKVLVSLKGVNINGRTPILRNVNWQVREGEKWLLKGHNGSGKTTLLSVILGDHPQSYALGDSVILFGRMRSAWATSQIHERIGHVSPEINNAFPRRGDLSTREAIGTGFEAVFCYRPLNEGQRRAVDDLASQLGRDERWLDARFAEQRPAEQNLALLMRALVKQPPLIVMDEPLAGMDDETILRVHEYLETGLKPEQSLVMVTHYESEVPASFNKVIQLSEGRVV